MFSFIFLSAVFNVSHEYFWSFHIQQLIISVKTLSTFLLPTIPVSDSTPPVHSKVDGKGVIDVPKFDGNIINWHTFWEQFDISVHTRANLSDSEKLVYLRHSLKDGSARNVIEGLSRSGEYYTEAVESLKPHYNRPRLVHQAHVRMIMEALPLKNGTGKELHRLHDTVQQHIRALKAIDYEPSGHFITSVLELKLDSNTMFEWQKESQDEMNVPHYLDFVNLRTQASEASASDSKGAHHSEEKPTKQNHYPTKPIASFTASTTDPTSSTCVACKSDKHPLYYCSQFKPLSRLKSHSLCLNCLRPGHHLKQCKSLSRCRKCQRPHHHTLLHVDSSGRETEAQLSSSVATINSVVSNTATGLKSNCLLMTCRVMI